MVLFLAFVIYPLINVIIMSFQQYNGVTPGTFNGLENYLKIFQEEDSGPLIGVPYTYAC